MPVIQIFDLCQVIKKLFCSSVPTEKLSSKAGEIISERRNRLKPENAEMIILLVQNF